MRICVISDTHGDIKKVVAYLKEHRKAFDEIWHLGDFIQDVDEIAKKTNLPYKAVKGNCDFGAASPEELQLIVGGKRIMLCHGHHFNVKANIMNLYYYAVQEQVDLICFGHTHVPAYEMEDGMLFFNPGSASLPRAGYHATIGLIEIEGDIMVATHINIDK